MEQDIKMSLEQLAPGHVTFDAPLAPLTTFGLGGPAAALVEPGSIAGLAGVIKFARTKKLPLFLLAAGSNVLFRDGGFPGVVIKLGPEFAKLKLRPSEGDQVTVEAGAAVPLARLVNLFREEGLSGLEFLAGIPGSVGGALNMNAGAFGGAISDALSNLEFLNAESRLEVKSRNQLSFSYRHLDLPEGSIILKALFRLTRSTPSQVRNKIRKYLDSRRAKQPTGLKSAGSVFKNPPVAPAGKLIDQAGLKGLTVGQAWISEKHANFIVHRGQARAGDVIKLIELVQAEIKKRFNVDLKTEIKIEGVDKETGSA